MIILAVDTSNYLGSLALLRDSDVLATRSIRQDERYSTSLLRELDALLSEASILLNQIDLFAVSGGPGSFTALRIGLTAVKAWAEIFSKPIAVVSGLRAVAAQASHSLQANSCLAVFLDGYQGQVFGAVYRSVGTAPYDLEQLGGEFLAQADEFIRLVAERVQGTPVSLASPVPAVLQPALARSSLACGSVSTISGELAPTVGLLGYRMALSGELVDALHLDANYIRRPDAEVKFKQT